jgi:AcrR family transcriptional regulator
MDTQMSEKTYHHGDLKNALIRAGIEILTQEGIGGLSLRKAARKAGVSHAAPYAHFADKQALIAAIASDGHRRIHERLAAALAEHSDDPTRLLLGAAWAYIRFGLEFPSHYKVTFSGTLENEHSHPEFVDYSQRNIRLLQDIVEQCRAAGILQTEGIDSENQAVNLWGQVHGLVSLVVQGQLPGRLLGDESIKGIFIAGLRQMVLVPIDEKMLAE